MRNDKIKTFYLDRQRITVRMKERLCEYIEQRSQQLECSQQRIFHLILNDVCRYFNQSNQTKLISSICKKKLCSRNKVINVIINYYLQCRERELNQNETI